MILLNVDYKTFTHIIKNMFIGALPMSLIKCNPGSMPENVHNNLILVCLDLDHFDNDAHLTQTLKCC